MKKFQFLALTAVLATAAATTNAQIFIEDFETGAGSSANFTVTENLGAGVTLTGTNSVVFGFDYGAHVNSTGIDIDIPTAPNSAASTTTGLQVAVNTGTTATGETAVNIYPNLPSVLPQNYKFQFDVYGNYATDNTSTTTEYLLWGAAGSNTDVLFARSPSIPESGANGNAFGTTLEGGAGTDAVYATGSGDPITFNNALAGWPGSTADAFWTAAIPVDPEIALAIAGEGSFKWITVELVVDQSLSIANVFFTTTIGRTTPVTSPRALVASNVPLQGDATNPFVGLYDRFSSLGGVDTFIVIDNIIITDETVSSTELWNLYN